MKFLIDEALEDDVAHRLVDGGHDATHVRAIGMQGATDDEVLAHAAGEQRILITTDTDFGTILRSPVRPAQASCCCAVSGTPSMNESAPSFGH